MSDGALSPQTRESLASEAFAYTARYDTSIARWFAEREEDFPDLYVRAYEKVVDLPYGENPHQRAAYYEQVGARMTVLSRSRSRARSSDARVATLPSALSRTSTTGASLSASR